VKLVPGQEFEVVEWLRGLGLERYAAAFRDAEITPEALPELNDASSGCRWGRAGWSSGRSTPSPALQRRLAGSYSAGNGG
jgi:SAM domain (Sterile alpha motif)